MERTDEAPPMFGLGDWLVRRRRSLDTGEAPWLEALVDFDRSEAWKLDGRVSCAEWLVWSCRMARSTAFEKLHVAHDLRRRPLVADAFREGEISYSAVRTILRVEDPEVEVDEALVELARSGTMYDLERAVRYYQLLAGQESDPHDRRRRYERRGVRSFRNPEGLGQAEVLVDVPELVEFERAIQVFIDRSAVDGSAVADRGGTGPVDESAVADCGGAGPVDESAVADSEGDGTAADGTAPDPSVVWGARRADAFMEMVRTALAHANDGHAVGADRYMLHVVADVEALAGGPGRCELGDGTPIAPDVLRRIACDSSMVGHLLRNGTEPLAVGRRSRGWTVAQRRAVLVRDGGRCRFPGCEARHTDIHHVVPWTDGGPTDVNNGASHCDRHHTALHQGFRVEGDANGTLTYHRPDGSFLGTSRPPTPGPALLRRAA